MSKQAHPNTKEEVIQSRERSPYEMMMEGRHSHFFLSSAAPHTRRKILCCNEPYGF